MRLEQALAALVRPEPTTTPQADLDTQTKRHPGGPKTKPDDARLLAIAREYFADTHGLFGKKRSITKIINEVTETDVPNSKELNLKQKKSIRRRLAKKFKEAPDRDRVMLKYSGGVIMKRSNTLISTKTSYAILLAWSSWTLNSGEGHISDVT